MDKTSNPIPPIIFLQILHMVFPRFAEKGENGGYQQQDANECWTEIVRSLQQKLKPMAALSGPDEPMCCLEEGMVKDVVESQLRTKSAVLPKDGGRSAPSFAVLGVTLKN
ncbi:ubiquitin carboxyl-terminal hydrolase 14 [Plakobranchus ocellatus]|uniref:ubiquitinyl hydrolase 1 n=1 Tax=Plakobranchus ocellatus TaxID=259542 RepID=A0AAV4BFT5_9GAST|nr:ubiquitin carboxyl-terminal hydrolase 14 [Plakobranchus ocellatus]